MNRLAITNQARGGVKDLAVAGSPRVEIWKVEFGIPAFRITTAAPGGRSLEWLITAVDQQHPELTEVLGKLGYGWTYGNDAAREWLKVNGYKELCDIREEAGREADFELEVLLGKLCRDALDGKEIQ